MYIEHPGQQSNHADGSGTHGLSYRESQVCIPRHAELNVIIQRALSPIHIPSIYLGATGDCLGYMIASLGLMVYPSSHGHSNVRKCFNIQTVAPGKKSPGIINLLYIY